LRATVLDHFAGRSVEIAAGDRDQIVKRDDGAIVVSATGGSGYRVFLELQKPVMRICV
jgi:hypothetical protein